MALSCLRMSRVLLRSSLPRPSSLTPPLSSLSLPHHFSASSLSSYPLPQQTLSLQQQPSLFKKMRVEEGEMMRGMERSFSSSPVTEKKKGGAQAKGQQTKGGKQEGQGGGKKKGPPKDISGYTPDKIRNFCIISHIDHGKTSLSTRILEVTNTIETIEKFETKQDSVEHSLFLDKLEVEKERGITVKAMTASILYEDPKTKEKYLLNLIDTPGHADFGYEVSRSMAACEGALLLVDASQGIQAQTMANYFLSIEQDLCIVPVVNKIDMQSARVEKTVEDMCSTFGVTEEQCLKVSAKNRIGIETIFPEILNSIPSPDRRGVVDAPFRALLFDSWFDTHMGVVCLVRVIDGSLTKGQKVSSLFSANEGVLKHYEVMDVGILNPEMAECTSLHSGQVGYICMGMKDTREAQIGDTFCLVGEEETVEALPGFQKQKPVVFAGVFPMEEGGFMHLGDCLAKLQLTDSSVVAQKTLSPALGAGFHCGFLGLLHMDVFLERLNQEYDIEVMPTAPTVSFRVKVKGNDDLITVEIPSEFPAQDQIEECFEPFVSANIICPESYLGDVMSLCQSRRGELETRDVEGERVFLTYNIPLEIITDFYDILKRITSGYASFTYENPVYFPSDLVRIDMLLNGEVVEPLVSIQHRSNLIKYGRTMAGKLKSTLKRAMFQIIIQATVGGKIVARETISAYRKDVTAKLYGGDVTRRMKLLNKQKEGKKRMKEFGRVGISQQDFYDILRK